MKDKYVICHVILGNIFIFIINYTNIIINYTNKYNNMQRVRCDISLSYRKLYTSM